MIVALGVGMVAAAWWAMSAMLRMTKKQLADQPSLGADAASNFLGALDHAYATGLWFVVGLLVLGIIFGTALNVAIARSIVNAAAKASKLGAAVAAGHLDIPVKEDGNDEMARMVLSLDSMRVELARMISETRDCTLLVDTASAEIDQGSQHLGDRTEKLASHLQRVASELRTLADTQSQNAESARLALSLVQNVVEAARMGQAAAMKMQTEMNRIRQHSTRIQEVVSVVQGIAFQTNVLALNASVESARAGDAGRGFAVVADEVRALAQRSATASKEIADLAVETTSAVDGGVQDATVMGDRVNNIKGLTSSLDSLIAELSASAAAGARTVSGVCAVIAELDTSAQSNAALVEQLSAVAQSLRHTSSMLTTHVRHYRLGSA